LSAFGDFVGGWGQYVGFLGVEGSLSTQEVESRVLFACSAALVVLFFGAIFYLRYAVVSGSPQIYLYLKLAAHYLASVTPQTPWVRFRGTHDRTALILPSFCSLRHH